MVKWIDDTQPDEPVRCLAARALNARLKAASRHLYAAAHEAHLDLEHIHDLRVATRRAVSTLEVFEDLLPRRRRKWLLKQLNKARRKAGDARDLDVFDSKIEGWIGHGAPEADVVQRQISACRHDVQPKIRRLYKKLRSKDFQRRARKLIRRLDWRRHESAEREPTVRDVAQQLCQPFLDRFAAAGDADLMELPQLHAFRVAGKNLRYALETFSVAFGSSLRDTVFPQLIDLQDQLGETIDQSAALSRLDDWIGQSDHAEKQQAFQTARQKIAALMEQGHKQFVQSWTPERAGQFLVLVERMLGGEQSAAQNGAPGHDGTGRPSADSLTMIPKQDAP